MIHICPFMDGNAVYTARVILHAFEPDSNYYNYCEFAKRPDRESSERYSNSEQNQATDVLQSDNLAYKVIPNPNNGTFSLLCPNNSNITVMIYDSRGAKVFEQIAKPNQSVLNIDMGNSSVGIYNMVITTYNTIHHVKFAITK